MHILYNLSFCNIFSWSTLWSCANFLASGLMKMRSSASAWGASSALEILGPGELTGSDTSFLGGVGSGDSLISSAAVDAGAL